MTKVFISTGGTGGHVFPAMDLGNELKKDPTIEVEFIGVGLKKNAYFEQDTYRYTDIIGANFSKGIFSGLKKITAGVLKARKKFAEEKVERVIGFGGFHSFPAILAAWSLRIPYDIVELNTYPGQVNRICSRFAKNNYIHFSASKKWLKGNAVLFDYDMKGGIKVPSKKDALSCLGLNDEKKVVLIWGGSQGSQSISKACFEALLPLKEKIQVIHVTTDVGEAVAFYKENNIKAFVSPLIRQIDLAYVAADIAVCRAGAGALREMMLFECPSILIPLKKAKEDHQTKNAMYMQNEIGGGIAMEDDEKLVENLKAKLKQLISEDENKIESMRLSLLKHKDSLKRKELVSYIRRSL